MSAIVYREAMFQSLYGLKRGGRLPETKAPGDFRRFMRQSAVVMKLLLCVFLAGAAVGGALGAAKASFPGVSRAASMAVAAGVSLLLVGFIITVMAMDMVTGFVASKAVHTLVLLPLSRHEVAAAALLGFLRIFDVPLVVGLLAFAASHAVLARSFVGAIAYLSGVATAEAFAVVLAFALAELFYAKVFNRTGGGLRNLARTLYLVMTIMPGMGMYFLFSYQASLGKAILAAIAENPSLAGALQFSYPACFGFLTSAASGADGATRGMLVASGVASAAYAALAARSLAWVGARLRARALGGVAGARRGVSRPTASHGSFRVRPVTPWLGVLVKDIRLVFRSPSEAALLIMPAAAVIPWAVVMGSSGRLRAGSLGVVSFMALMAVTAVPALFNVETVGQSYVRTLPVEARWTLAAKAAVATTTYMVSVVVLLAMAALTGRAEMRVLVTSCGSGALQAAAGSLVTGFVLLQRSGSSRRLGKLGKSERLDRGKGSVRDGGGTCVEGATRVSGTCARAGEGGGGARVSPFMSPGVYLKAMTAGGLFVALPHVAANAGQTALGLAPLPRHFAVGVAELALVAAVTLSDSSARW
jgi:hypothetical protein